MNERIILHVDANNFFASVETSLDPKLKDKAVAVSGNPKKRNGIILAKNMTAKKCGVETGEPIWQALQKCPDLVCIPPHMKIYEDFSQKLRKIYERYTDKVEAFSIDECFLDVTTTTKYFGDGKTIADLIRQDVRNELNITVSVGVSFCKTFAKLGSDLKKPDATTVIGRNNFMSIVYPLNITELCGIGHRLERRFNKLNVFKLGEIPLLEDFVLKSKFGIIGLQLKQKLLGLEDNDVAKCDYYRMVKSVGNGTTTIRDIKTIDEVKTVVSVLCDEISTRLRQKNLIASGISVTIKNCLLLNEHKTKKIGYYVNSSKDLQKEAMSLIATFWKYNEKIRAIRICSYGLKLNDNAEQLSLFNPLILNTPLNKTIDNLRKKYGYTIIGPASTKKSDTLNMERLVL